MSYEGWTELERKAGLPFIDDDIDDDLDESRLRPNGRTRRNGRAFLSRANARGAISESPDAGKLAEKCASKFEVRMRLSRVMLLTDFEEMINRYAARERLPAEFVATALRMDAIAILLKTFLREAIGIYATKPVLSRILRAENSICSTGSSKTTFERVGFLQEILHQWAIEVRGSGGQLDLSPRLMSHILSSARLHLALKAIYGESPEYWGSIWDEEMAASKREKIDPQAGFIPPGKRRIRDWRVLQKKPLTHYASEEVRAALDEIAALPGDVSLREYRQRTAEIVERVIDGRYAV